MDIAGIRDIRIRLAEQVVSFFAGYDLGFALYRFVAEHSVIFHHVDNNMVMRKGGICIIQQVSNLPAFFQAC